MSNAHDAFLPIAKQGPARPDASGDFAPGMDRQFLAYLQSRRSAMQVSKWGSSLAIRLPAAVVEAMQLEEGDDIEIHVAG